MNKDSPSHVETTKPANIINHSVESETIKQDKPIQVKEGVVESSSSPEKTKPNITIPIRKRKKGKYPITKRQLAYVKARLAGRNQRESHDIAGYGANSAPGMVEKTEGVRRAINAVGEELEKMGIGAREIAVGLAEGLKATRIGKMGESKDYETRLAYIKHIGIMEGYGGEEKGEKGGQVNIQINLDENVARKYRKAESVDTE